MPKNMWKAKYRIIVGIMVAIFREDSDWDYCSKDVDSGIHNLCKYLFLLIEQFSSAAKHENPGKMRVQKDIFCFDLWIIWQIEPISSLSLNYEKLEWRNVPAWRQIHLSFHPSSIRPIGVELLVQQATFSPQKYFLILVSCVCICSFYSESPNLLILEKHF